MPQTSAMNRFLIIVPTLNSYTILPTLVDSFVSQTYPNWNVLFVDGPSSSAHKAWIANLCLNDKRFLTIDQAESCSGIYGAMNDGLLYVSRYSSFYDWFIFLGSDDWLSSSQVLFKLNLQLLNYHASNLTSTTLPPDFLVCTASFYHQLTSKVVRTSSFNFPFIPNILNSKLFRLMLALGAVPAHQATVFSSKGKSISLLYNSNFKIAADLDWFLHISSTPGLTVFLLNHHTVYMSHSGISQRNISLKVRETISVYRSAFKYYWPFTLLLRYLFKAFSLV